MRLLDPVHDESDWLDAWERTGREPFAHPAYGRWLARHDESPHALLVEVEGGDALVPLTLRRVPDAPHLEDATSPYGYGGPFLPPGGSATRALQGLAEWVTAERLCSCFLRLSLDADVPSGRLTPAVEVVEVQDNVVVDLRRDEVRLWAEYEHKVRKNVNKALRGGLRVERTDSLQDPREFAAVYLETMSRRDAGAAYRFGEGFFTGLCADLAGSYSVFIVRDPAGRAVSVELVLESEQHLYSFLGGTRADAFALSPNDLLKHEVVLHGVRTGRSGFVLGGGYGGQDGIFRYKRSFDRNGVRPFRVGRVLGLPEEYARLTAARSAAGADTEGFFPGYRAPVPSPI